MLYLLYSCSYVLFLLFHDSKNKNIFEVEERFQYFPFPIGNGNIGNAGGV